MINPSQNRLSELHRGNESCFASQSKEREQFHVHRKMVRLETALMFFCSRRNTFFRIKFRYSDSRRRGAWLCPAGSPHFISQYSKWVNFSTGCESDAFEPTLCNISSINNHQQETRNLLPKFRPILRRLYLIRAAKGLSLFSQCRSPVRSSEWGTQKKDQFGDSRGIVEWRTATDTAGLTLAQVL